MTRVLLRINSGQRVVLAMRDLLPWGLCSSWGDNMGPTQGCWTLCSILLLRLSQAVLIKIPQDLVNGTVGQSVLLPVSYKLSSSSHFPLPFHWTFSNRSERIVTCTVLNCSLSAEGTPKHCSAKHFPHAAYQGRVVLFPENASLLLRDLQLKDSGVYSVTFKQQIQTRRITLTVYSEARADTDARGGRSGQKILVIIAGCFCLILLLLLLFCYAWHRGAVLQLMRCMNQQVQHPCEPSVENILERSLSGIYISLQ
ncbi:uncharacterized protein LOC112987746 isoform X2 [Dromaius novaehollandiae]|uniref:uncharacterized protein LOC112987746 isoform X2 n=1 Tax=Dromaius novaehollandiae TaxID=8790 RepID=UPI00311FD103